MRNRDGRIVGLTCRAGRVVTNSAAMAADLIASKRSILFMVREQRPPHPQTHTKCCISPEAPEGPKSPEPDPKTFAVLECVQRSHEIH
jgi:hypothetical protein